MDVKWIDFRRSIYNLEYREIEDKLQCRLDWELYC